MKYLVTGHQVIPGAGHKDQANYLRAAKDWVSRHKQAGQLEAVYSFTDGGGVFIMNVPNHEELMKLLLTFPLSPLTQWSVRPMIDFNESADIIINSLKNFA
ncbi:Muconolactone delta-isomerase [Dehalogenimonas formicexedens]|uniref:Muconolactone delta-isomerase n=1 Tax=Dehalogenimonas formicexedens TaxID=1839801 RepID=A0A1P8FAJ6_9CHLR|nr:muconolactone Delta-isomerase family protein [Dehalogenimonas formicexedens]APV45471.1 Muconolactone delta-isomerase [Dehalogenimonas formicexedens]